jgi:hypothetical protein
VCSKVLPLLLLRLLTMMMMAMVLGDLGFSTSLMCRRWRELEDEAALLQKGLKSRQPQSRTTFHLPQPHSLPPFQRFFFSSATVAAVRSNLLLPRFCAFANGRCGLISFCLLLQFIIQSILSRIFSCSNTTSHLRVRISNFD